MPPLLPSDLSTTSDADLSDALDRLRAEQARRAVMAAVPAQAAALNARYLLARDGDPDPDSPAPWVQPTGAHDAYGAGEFVLFEGEIYESLVDGNAYSPSAHPPYWQHHP